MRTINIPFKKAVKLSAIGQQINGTSPVKKEGGAKKRGRPRKAPEDKVKYATLSFKLEPSLLATFQKKAKRAKLPQSKFFRKLVEESK